MTIKAFFKLTEIQTKVASVIPFLLGLTYTLYTVGSLNALNMVIMFFAMIIFDMSVTSINNYTDHKRAVKKHGYGYETHNAITQYNLKESAVVACIVAMVLVSAALGVWLVLLTNWVVLLLGMACFTIGILYSYGPMPISHTPFGEIFSGITMGFIITFIVIYINVYNQGLFNIVLKLPKVFIEMNLWMLVGIGLVTLPAVFGIANIMLANNICDIEDDIENKRHTLPIVIGKQKALNLLQMMYYAGYGAIVVAVVFKFLPLYALLVLLTLIPVVKNIKAFKQNSTKKDTFGLCVANFVLVNVALILTLVLGVLDGVFLNFLV